MTLKDFLISGHTCKVKRNSLVSQKSIFQELRLKEQGNWRKRPQLQLKITWSIQNFFSRRSCFWHFCNLHKLQSITIISKHCYYFIMAVLEDLTRIFKELGLIAEKQEKRIQLHEKKAQHLTITYLIFQGMVFMSITIQVSSSQCQNWWVPFTLCLLSSLILLLGFLEYRDKFLPWSISARLEFHRAGNCE